MYLGKVHMMVMDAISHSLVAHTFLASTRPLVAPWRFKFIRVLAPTFTYSSHWFVACVFDCTTPSLASVGKAMRT